MVYQLYDSAFRILDIRNNLLENFPGSRKQIIDLAASTIPSSYLLPELLAGFDRMYPDVYFHSWQTDSSGAINRVLDGTVDLALTGQNTGDDSCVFIPFCQDNMVIATPVNDHYLNLKQKEQPVVFQDFINEPSSLNVVARMNDLESIKKSIVNGLGFSILSARSVVDLQKTKQILLFPLEESAHKRSFYIVYSKNRILKSHVRQFIHYVKEYYQTV